MNDKRNRKYDIHNSDHRRAPVGGRVKRWMSLDGCGAVMRRNVTTYFSTPFTCSTEEETYASRPAMIVQISSVLTRASPVTLGLAYVTFPCPFDWLQRFTNFEYWWKEIPLKTVVLRWVPGCIVFLIEIASFFGVPTRNQKTFFVRVRW